MITRSFVVGVLAGAISMVASGLAQSDSPHSDPCGSAGYWVECLGALYQKGDRTGAEHLVEANVARNCSSAHACNAKVLYIGLYALSSHHQFDAWNRVATRAMQAVGVWRSTGDWLGADSAREALISGLLAQNRVDEADHLLQQMIDDANTLTQRGEATASWLNLESLSRDYAGRGLEKQAKMIAEQAARFKSR